MANLNEFTTQKEKDFTSELQNELVQLSGVPCYYLKKTNVNLDKIFGEDDLTKYEDAVEIYLLPDDPSTFSGAGDMFAQFGMTAIDNMTMYSEIGNFQTVTGLSQPVEKDLVYIPIFNSWYEIGYMDDEGGSNSRNTFFWNGVVACFTIELTKYIHSHETISTSVAEVDDNIPETDNQIDTDNTTVSDYERENALNDEFDEMLKDEKKS